MNIKLFKLFLSLTLAVPFGTSVAGVSLSPNIPDLSVPNPGTGQGLEDALRDQNAENNPDNRVGPADRGRPQAARNESQPNLSRNDAIAVGRTVRSFVRDFSPRDLSTGKVTRKLRVGYDFKADIVKDDQGNKKVVITLLRDVNGMRIQANAPAMINNGNLIPGSNTVTSQNMGAGTLFVTSYQNTQSHKFGDTVMFDSIGMSGADLRANKDTLVAASPAGAGSIQSALAANAPINWITVAGAPNAGGNQMAVLLNVTPVGSGPVAANAGPQNDNQPAAPGLNGMPQPAPERGNFGPDAVDVPSNPIEISNLDGVQIANIPLNQIRPALPPDFKYEKTMEVVITPVGANNIRQESYNAILDATGLAIDLNGANKQLFENNSNVVLIVQSKDVNFLVQITPTKSSDGKLNLSNYQVVRVDSNFSNELASTSSIESWNATMNLWGLPDFLMFN